MQPRKRIWHKPLASLNTSRFSARRAAVSLRRLSYPWLAHAMRCTSMHLLPPSRTSVEHPCAEQILGARGIVEHETMAGFAHRAKVLAQTHDAVAFRRSVARDAPDDGPLVLAHHRPDLRMALRPVQRSRVPIRHATRPGPRISPSVVNSIAGGASAWSTRLGHV